MQKKIILIGAGGHARSCIDVIENSNSNFKILGLIEKRNLNKKTFSKYKVIYLEKNLNKITKKNIYALVGFGDIKNLKKREIIFNKLINFKFKIPIIKSKNAYISSNSKIGSGTIVMHGVTINFGSKIGKNCIINSNATIEHDVIIGNHCHIAPGAIINGGVKIGDYSFIGSGAVIKENIKISENCIVGANCFLKKNLSKKKIFK